jgi:prophage regulatory protein
VISIFPIIALVETTEEKQMRNEIAGKRLIRVPEVLRRVGFSRTTMYELIKEGRFPDKVIIGARSVAFVESEIDAWIENTISDSRRNNK